MKEIVTEKEIADIAEGLMAGFRCYIKKEDGSVIETPDIGEFSDTYELWEDKINEIAQNSDSYVSIEKMDSWGSFRLRERSIDIVTDQYLQRKLTDALSKRKPFRHFKFEIDNSGPWRNKWFEFYKLEVVAHVKKQLELENL